MVNTIIRRQQEIVHSQWSSRWAFILAATGSAVGLGNIWKFPYITGENGGGAFVLIYLGCIAFIGIPIMIAEVLLGRRGRQSPINTMRELAKESDASSYWSLLGWGGVAAGLMILSFYSVIAGWALAYLFRVCSGLFESADAETVNAIFSNLVRDPERLLAWHTIFMTMTMIVVSRGVRGGLERAVRFLMPGLLILLMILMGYAMMFGEFMEGVRFLFTPDFGRINGTGFLVAMGHAFFTLSLGMGAIMVYGSYLSRETSIARTSVTIALADTAVALIAGLVIFPIVFAHGLEPGAGPGLIFKTLPIAFGQMPLGSLFGTLFFVLLVFAAWTSAISVIEPTISWLVETRGMTRIKASTVSGIIVWTLGLGTVFSFNIGADYTFGGKTFFDILDFLASNIMLPLGGLAIAIFVGWVLPGKAVREELSSSRGFYRVWFFVVKYIAPPGVFAVFLHAVGLLS